MGSILKRKRKDGKTIYLAQVRKAGHEPRSESFESQAEAKRWMIRLEAELDAATESPAPKPAPTLAPTPPSVPQKRAIARKSVDAPEDDANPEPKRKERAKDRRRFGDLIDRYLKEVMPHKSSRYAPTLFLEWWRTKLGNLPPERITPAEIAQLKARLMAGRTPSGKKRSPATVNRYLATLSHVFTVAIKEWFWVDENPVLKVQKLREPPGRVRFLSDDERERLLEACRQGPPTLFPVVVLALYTGMRYGEIANLRWKDVDLARRRLTLEKTKNRTRRGVPLLGPAFEVLVRWAAEHPKALPTQLVFPGPRVKTRPASLKRPWHQAMESAGVENFRFHDLRHCTASYMAMSGATPQEIAEVLGHKTLQMVHRYSHLAETHVRSVLEKMVTKFSTDLPEEE